MVLCSSFPPGTDTCLSSAGHHAAGAHAILAAGLQGRESGDGDTAGRWSCGDAGDEGAEDVKLHGASWLAHLVALEYSTSQMYPTETFYKTGPWHSMALLGTHWHSGGSWCVIVVSPWLLHVSGWPWWWVLVASLACLSGLHPWLASLARSLELFDGRGPPI